MACRISGASRVSRGESTRSIPPVRLDLQCTRTPQSNSAGRFGHRRASRSLAAALCDPEQRRAGLFDTVCGMAVWILGAVIASITIVIIPRMRAPGGVNGSALGWMSEQWLAEHRASHSV